MDLLIRALKSDHAPLLVASIGLAFLGSLAAAGAVLAETLLRRAIKKEGYIERARTNDRSEWDRIRTEVNNRRDTLAAVFDDNRPIAEILQPSSVGLHEARQKRSDEQKGQPQTATTGAAVFETTDSNGPATGSLHTLATCS
jgi:hypothetical protein